MLLSRFPNIDLVAWYVREKCNFVKSHIAYEDRRMLAANVVIPLNNEQFALPLNG